MATQMRIKKRYWSIPYYQDAILGYYAHKYHRDILDILRTIIPLFARADDRFKAEEYQAYVRDRYVPHLHELVGEEVTPELLQDLEEQIENFLADDYDPAASVFLSGKRVAKTPTKASNRSKAKPRARAKKTR